MFEHIANPAAYRRAASCAAASLSLCLAVAGTPARAETDVKITLSAPYDGSNSAFFLADERGYYRANGLKVTLDPSGGSGEAVTRIGSGTYDFGVGDVNVLMEFNAKNPANAGLAVYLMYSRSPLSAGGFAGDLQPVRPLIAALVGE